MFGVLMQRVREIRNPMEAVKVGYNVRKSMEVIPDLLLRTEEYLRKCGQVQKMKRMVRGEVLQIW